MSMMKTEAWVTSLMGWEPDHLCIHMPLSGSLILHCLCHVCVHGSFEKTTYLKEVRFEMHRPLSWPTLRPEHPSPFLVLPYPQPAP